MAGRQGKLKLQYIMDRAKRKRTLEKRLPIVLKKAMEFSVLCDVPTGLVAYLPGVEQPVTWPSPDEACRVLRQYKEAGDSRKLKQELDNPVFMAKLVEKEEAKLYTLQRQIRDQESNLLVADFLAGRRGRFDDMPPEAFAALESKAQERLGAVKERLQELRRGAVPPPLPAQLQLVPFAQAPPKEMVQQAPPLMAPAPPFSQNLSTPLLQADVQFPLALDDFGLPTTEELEAILVKAGIFTTPQPNPFHDDAI